MDEFLGLRQIREHGNVDLQDFTISVFHRFVRHPWYCFSLALIWTRDMNGPLLVSAVAITVYFIVGSKLEERKLIARYGEKYRRYIARVPALVPLPWKYLTAAEAEALALAKQPPAENR
jgi:steroid 5-alpha reductase family enzyme